MCTVWNKLPRGAKRNCFKIYQLSKLWDPKSIDGSFECELFQLLIEKTKSTQIRQQNQFMNQAASRINRSDIRYQGSKKVQGTDITQTKF